MWQYLSFIFLMLFFLACWSHALHLQALIVLLWQLHKASGCHWHDNCLFLTSSPFLFCSFAFVLQEAKPHVQ